jgi:hypothetical protein
VGNSFIPAKKLFHSAKICRLFHFMFCGNDCLETKTAVLDERAVILSAQVTFLIKRGRKLV